MALMDQVGRAVVRDVQGAVMRAAEVVIVAAALLAVCLPAQAQQQQRSNRPRPPPTLDQPITGVGIGERDRDTIRTYFSKQFANGICPAGLAKKDNSCLPPADRPKAWTRGQPLAAAAGGVPLPNDLVIKLRSPVGYSFVRVQNDVLLIAQDTRIVIDAVPDIH